MSDYLVPLSIEADGWGKVNFLRALPRDGDPWGVLACLRGTPWEAVVCVVEGEALSHALHGHPWPFLRSLDVSPQRAFRRLASADTHCLRFLDKSCPVRDKAKCLPGDSLPLCYEAPHLEPGPALVAYEVAQALKEGSYILVVTGPTFSL